MYICVIERINIDEKSGSSEINKHFMSHGLQCPKGHLGAVFFCIQNLWFISLINCNYKLLASPALTLTKRSTNAKLITFENVTF